MIKQIPVGSWRGMGKVGIVARKTNLVGGLELFLVFPSVRENNPNCQLTNSFQKGRNQQWFIMSADGNRFELIDKDIPNVLYIFFFTYS